MDTLLCIIAIVAIALFLYFNSNEKKFQKEVDQLYQWKQANIELLRKEMEDGKITPVKFAEESWKYDKVYHDGWWVAFKKYKVK
ncbi:hypothetical protein [Acetanaerobacterium elongatum]|uniref:Uncharacterized protein n=1 Tax=Acetanaerobacterium elongatum TaxID=258515 RepID=A0A1H0BNB1_9FIRM|nr:hypothetical protein [Acetanaerobacterium elongatum]SDN47114.1 hypothetical protein SAMN05192585_12013 [Acetanaerobacterium elongatum]